MTNDTVQNTMPKELVINIDLPLLNAANSVNLEIFERQLLLESEKPAKYKLNLKLPYRVSENEGNLKRYLVVLLSYCGLAKSIYSVIFFV